MSNHLCAFEYLFEVPTKSVGGKQRHKLITKATLPKPYTITALLISFYQNTILRPSGIANYMEVYKAKVLNSFDKLSGNKINTCVANDDVFEQVGVCHFHYRIW